MRRKSALGLVSAVIFAAVVLLVGCEAPVGNIGVQSSEISKAARGEWAPNVAYAVGDTVTYQGTTYTCRQAHTSLVGWEPPNVPALWLAGGTTTTTPTPTPTPSTTATPTPVSSLPDLIVTNITWAPSSPAVGAGVTFTVTIKNQGGAATPAGTKIGIAYLVDGTKVSWTGNYFPNPGLAAGASISLAADGGPTGASTWTATSGSHTVTAQVDDVALVAESNEGNNTSGGFSLTVGTGTTPTPTPTPTPSTGSSLIPLNAGAQMTFQFKNNTNGAYADSQIYVLMVARNSAGKFSYLDKSGNFIQLSSGQNLSSFSYKMSDFAGFQFPTFIDSGRLYVSLGSALDIPVNTDVNGNVGIAFPNIENPSDANINKDFEWVEFAVINNQIWCNTTQVDQFGFPMTMELYSGSSSSYSLFGKVGLTESRATLYNAWTSSVPAAFQSLKTTHRILAPLHGNFRSGQANGTYFDAYINSIWSQYTSSNLVITIPQGTFTGRVQGDGRIAFTKPGDGATYFVSKPNGDAVWGGLGALASGNATELALEAQICAAFHRHVMGNSSTWNTPSQYYLAAPADYYSKFFHDHSINAKAYGFCYDDVNDQSSTMTVGSPRGIILGVGW